MIAVGMILHLFNCYDVFSLSGSTPSDRGLSLLISILYRLYRAIETATMRGQPAQYPLCGTIGQQRDDGGTYRGPITGGHRRGRRNRPVFDLQTLPLRIPGYMNIRAAPVSPMISFTPFFTGYICH